MSAQRINFRSLSELCRKMHREIYFNRKRQNALKLLPELHSMLKIAPKSSVAILLAEARAIYHELSGNIEKAISYRQREIALMERLYMTVRKDNYDVETRKFVLQNRNSKDFTKRKSILKALQKQI